MYACLFQPQSSDAGALAAVAQEFSPRYERHRDDLVTIDVRGLERLIGTARTIGEELRREAAARGLRVHVALAATRMAARLLAQARPGLTVVEPGREAATLAQLPIGILERIDGVGILNPLKRWGVNTLGELAALPPNELAARLGQSALVWQAVARGEDVRPLVPTLPEEPFASTLDLDWPIEGSEPLSFVLTRLLEPLSIRLEREDRGVAVLHVELGLVTPEAVHTCRLQLPSPTRDVRTLRTLALLDLDAHPPSAAIDRVTLVIDPTPGRVLQHTLFTRAHPTPDRLSTLVARLGALMGHDRIGRPSPVDTYRPGAFAMVPFATEHDQAATAVRATPPSANAQARCGALRRCRRPVPARVAVVDGRPARVTADARAFAGGAVVRRAGPWRTSGDWWAPIPWNRDEWDVALSDGAAYRIFRERDTDRWFIDAIAD